MVGFITEIQKFGNKGEKTGWTYIEIPEAIALQLKPGNRQTFRVRGRLDRWSFKGLSLMPMGDGSFILPINSTIRKKIKKIHGAMLEVVMEEDPVPPELNEDLLACLEDAPEAKLFFDTLTPGHQRYFSNWIESAKTEPTKVKRLAQCINGLERKLDFGGLLRQLREQRNERH